MTAGFGIDRAELRASTSAATLIERRYNSMHGWKRCEWMIDDVGLEEERRKKSGGRCQEGGIMVG